MIYQQDKTQGRYKTINKARPSQEIAGLCLKSQTMTSLITTPLQVQVTNRPFWKPRNKEENGKWTLFPSHCFQHNILGKLWVLAETQREEEKNFETISWSLFLKSSICSSLHMLWLAFLQISRHPMQEESKVYRSLLLCSTELHRKFYCTFAASNFPRLFNNSLLLQHKRQARNLKPHFSAPDRTWHYTRQRLTIWLVLWKRSDCTVTRMQRKKEESFVKPNL